MSDLIVSKPFLRGSKRYRRGEPAPTDLDKVTQDEYMRLGLLGRNRLTTAASAPSNTKPAGPTQTTAPSSGRKRESAKPKDVKATTAANAPGTGAASTASAGAASDACVPASQPDGSVHTSAQGSGDSSGAGVDGATGADASGASTNQADGSVHTSAQESGDSSAAAPVPDASGAQPEA